MMNVNDKLTFWEEDELMCNTAAAHKRWTKRLAKSLMIASTDWAIARYLAYSK